MSESDTAYQLWETERDLDAAQTRNAGAENAIQQSIIDMQKLETERDAAQKRVVELEAEFDNPERWPEGSRYRHVIQNYQALVERVQGQRDAAIAARQAAETDCERLKADLAVNARMLARQCDLAREVENGAAANRAELTALRAVAEAGQQYVEVSDSPSLSESGGDIVALDDLADALAAAGYGPQEAKP